MKNKEERDERKNGAETLNEKRAELTENDLEQVTGGISTDESLVIPTIVLDKKGNVVNFKIDVPAAEEADVVELNIAN